MNLFDKYVWLYNIINIQIVYIIQLVILYFISY